MHTGPHDLSDIPRLPVLGWATFGGERQAGLSSVLDVPHRVFTTSGRSAIGLALEVLGVGPGDRVLVPTYNCPTMIAPVLHAGAEPVFFPIDERGNPKRAFLDGLELPKVRAIIAAHYFGLPQSFAWLRQWCNRRSVFFIEDCAHAFYGDREGTAVGCTGDVAIASLTKFFPVTEGGCLVSARHDLHRVELRRRGPLAAAKKLSDSIEMGARHGRFGALNFPLHMIYRTKDFLRGGAEAPPPDYNGEPVLEEFNDPMMRSAIAASLPMLIRGVGQTRIVARRRHNYARLAELLRDAPGARPLFPNLAEGAAPYVFPLHVDHASARYLPLRETRMPLFRWDRIWPGTPRFEGDAGLQWSADIFQLACHQDLEEEHLGRMAAAIKNIFARHGADT